MTFMQQAFSPSFLKNEIVWNIYSEVQYLKGEGKLVGTSLKLQGCISCLQEKSNEKV